MNSYKFYKINQCWYIDLPEFIEQGGSIEDLQMVEGADRLLDIIAAGAAEVMINISAEPIEDAAILQLTERCDPLIGGGYYFIQQYQQQPINLTVWLCNVTTFVFGNLPERIFIKKDNVSN